MNEYKMLQIKSRKTKKELQRERELLEEEKERQENAGMNKQTPEVEILSLKKMIKETRRDIGKLRKEEERLRSVMRFSSVEDLEVTFHPPKLASISFTQGRLNKLIQKNIKLCTNV